MGYAAHGVAAFAGEVQPQGALRIRREGHALRYQPSYGGFAVLCNMLRCALIDYACASVQRIVHVAGTSLPSTPTMPPCAEAVVEDFRSLRLASTMTGAWSARCKATVRPASPAPTTTTGKSVCLHKVCASERGVDVFMAEDGSKGSFGAKAREQKSTSKSWL